METPEYLGQPPFDQTTYRVSSLRVRRLKAIGVGGSNEPIKTFQKYGVWHIECPAFAVNPKHIKFEIEL